MATYLDDWEYPTEAESFDALKSSFGIDDTALLGVDILAASYTNEDYSGRAVVVFTRDGKPYVVHGSHCSCYRLEDQWVPEETSLAALQYQVEHGWDGTIMPALRIAIRELS